MVATFVPGSPLSWRPTTRALGALFTGSAMMFTVAFVHGGTLLTTGNDRAEPATTTLSENTGTGRVAANGGADPVPLVSPGQGAGWAPGGSPAEEPLRPEQPIRPVPMQAVPHRPGSSQTGSATDSADQAHPGSADNPFTTPGPPDQESEDGVLDGVLGYFTK